MRILVLPLLEPHQDPVLAGRLEGKRAFSLLAEKTASITLPTVVIVNFRSVALATSSYLSEAVLRLRDHLSDYMRRHRVPTYLVVANPAEKVREELEELLTRAGDALLSCDCSLDEQISNPTLIGVLDPKLRETFELVKSKREATATELHSESDDGASVGATAWNNRLNMLVAKGLLLEIPMGRAKKYRPVLEFA